MCKTDYRTFNTNQRTSGVYPQCQGHIRIYAILSKESESYFICTRNIGSLVSAQGSIESSPPAQGSLKLSTPTQGTIGSLSSL